MTEKRGILVVSFGTSYENTRKKTLGAIEDSIRNAYPQIPVYSAWTSRKIAEKLLKTTGEKIYSVDEALEKMKLDKISHVYIQSTHVINGIEYELLKEDASKWLTSFSAVSIGKPLLSTTDDMQKLTRIIADEFSEILREDPNGKTALLLMGHGTEHHSNTGYAALDYMFKETGHPNIHVGTVESYPSLSQIIPFLKSMSVKTLHLAPLMVVAGDHAENDMAGSTGGSWAAQLKCAGYDVTCHMKGLGEYPAVRQLFLQHLREIME
ncbi:MAG: sirohydrochlorin cobaltochelatase [Dorea sp.]|nr:sirohydrochlorin cobaltochelatase [Dorea sp.]